MRFVALLAACSIFSQTLFAQDIDVPERSDFLKMDIGQLHHSYRSIGALGEGFTGMEWPAELKGSSSIRAEGFWLGVKDWTDTDSVFYPYYVTRVGPKFTDSSSVTAVSSRLVSKWHRPEVTVNGIPFETKSNYNDEYEVDPMDG